MTVRRVAAISVYPVKSAAGMALDACRVELRGLAGDRRWMVTDPTGRFLTGREHPRLVLVRARIVDDGLRLETPGLAPLTVTRSELQVRSRIRAVTIWGDGCEGVDTGDEAAAWFGELLGTPARLVEMTDDCSRRADPEVARPGDLVSFADCFPVLLIGSASLDDLNARLGEPASMRRFRPNLVVEGAPPFAEDHWWRIRIGEVELEGAENCERCAFPTIDPDTGVKDSRREPMRTLATYRRRAEGGVFLGQSLIPRTLGTIRVGDAVEVLT
ncbi:MAG: MOSC domain-containing protein [Immundisolibacterales bacterium]|nr:MOSC domain-containing protein [Immundisolibacterales bacterium]